jgi:DnaJ-class molecular chaperone
MPDVYGRRPPGDLMVVARVGVPKNLSDNQKRLLRDFAAADSSSEKPGEVDKGFIGKVMDSFR